MYSVPEVSQWLAVVLYINEPFFLLLNQKASEPLQCLARVSTPKRKYGNAVTHALDWNNRPFPSCFEPHYESEAKCKGFLMKISFHSYANKTNFHLKSFALSLAFIMRFTGTRNSNYYLK